MKLQTKCVSVDDLEKLVHNIQDILNGQIQLLEKKADGNYLVIWVAKPLPPVFVPIVPQVLKESDLNHE